MRVLFITGSLFIAFYSLTTTFATARVLNSTVADSTHNLTDVNVAADTASQDKKKKPKPKAESDNFPFHIEGKGCKWENHNCCRVRGGGYEAPTKTIECKDILQKNSHLNWFCYQNKKDKKVREEANIDSEGLTAVADNADEAMHGGPRWCDCKSLEHSAIGEFELYRNLWKGNSGCPQFGNCYTGDSGQTTCGY